MKKTFLIIILSFLFYYGVNEKVIEMGEIREYRITNHLLAKKIAYNHNVETNHPFVEFCEKYQEIAIFYQIEYGIPVSIQLAQAIAESGGGKSQLAQEANNLFGMKYYKSLYDGEFFTSESGTKWRKYNNFEHSFEDHAKFLKKFYPSALNKDWKYWTTNCKGYGGDNYWTHIGHIIEKYNLGKYDIIVGFALKFNKSYQI